MPQLTTDTTEKANAIGMRFNSDVTRIRESSDLTAEAKQRHIAERYDKARAEMTELRSGWEKKAADREKALTRDLFGSSTAVGSDAISFRDAADRATQLDRPSDALAMLRPAGNTGDTVLARAVAQHAFEQLSNPLGGHLWQKVVATYAENFAISRLEGRGADRAPARGEPAGQLHGGHALLGKQAERTLVTTRTLTVGGRPLRPVAARTSRQGRPESAEPRNHRPLGGSDDH